MFTVEFKIWRAEVLEDYELGLRILNTYLCIEDRGVSDLEHYRCVLKLNISHK